MNPALLVLAWFVAAWIALGVIALIVLIVATADIFATPAPEGNDTRVVCKWFHKEERFLSGNPFGRRVSHGLCKECSQKFQESALAHLNPEIAHKI